jgi:hypothetical protein
MEKRRPHKGEGSQVLRAKGLGPDVEASPNPDRHYRYLPALGEIEPTYEKKVPCASGSRALAAKMCKPMRFKRTVQNGLTTARITMPIMSTVGTSLRIR